MTDRRSFPANAQFSIYTLADGWEIRLVEFQPQGSARGTILAANGRGDFIEKYIEIFTQFSAAGWRVVSFDWRGQGGSGRLARDSASGHIDDFAVWIDDYAQIVRDVRRSCEPFILFGHSMGGHLVLRALTDNAVTADAAILSAPMLGIKTPGLNHSVARWLAGVMANLGDSTRRAWKGSTSGAEFQKNLTHDEVRYADESWWRAQDERLALGSPSWGWIKAAYDSIRLSFTPERLAQVKIPVLMLIAEADRLVDPRYANRAAAALPNVTAIHFGDEASHEILRERDAVRQRALAVIDVFLNRLFPR